MAFLLTSSGIPLPFYRLQQFHPILKMNTMHKFKVTCLPFLRSDGSGTSDAYSIIEFALCEMLENYDLRDLA